jgi:Membrane-bound lysozyme-inhibitor of c-type lysozyme
MSISFTRVTWYSQIVAIILFVLVWYVGFCVGRYWVSPGRMGTDAPLTGVVNAAVFRCDMPADSFISSVFYSDRVSLTLSNGRRITLPHALSADGARYANADESFVFWNKGNTAFIEEQGTTTWSGCVMK